MASILSIALSVSSIVPAVAHNCQMVGNVFLRGNYEGDCDERTELAHGKGRATGADSYAGMFIKGKPDGAGTYTWENGARLTGTFKEGRAHGAGVYISAGGVRYEGEFIRGRLEGILTSDCPTTQGPITCKVP